MGTFTPHVIAQRTKVVVVAVIILAIGFLCQVLAVLTPGWLFTSDVTVGLFLYCGILTIDTKTESLYDCQPLRLQHTPDSMQAVRLLGIASTVLTLASFITGCVNLWQIVRYEKINHKLASASVLLALIAVAITIITCIVLGTTTKHQMPSRNHYTYDLSYSFYLYLIGGISTLLGMVLVIASVKSLIRLLLV